MTLAVIVLAAGQGTRMRSNIPKVLHPLAGKPLLEHVIDAVSILRPEECIVVVGHGAEQVQDTIANSQLTWVVQEKQLGTGHAVQTAMPLVTADNILALYGDVPLISSATLKSVVAGVEPGKMNLLTIHLEDPQGYGRIVRNSEKQIQQIVEQKDADATTLEITEGNTGILCATREDLLNFLSNLQNNNVQGEYYLTDCIERCIIEGGTVNGILANQIAEVSGVNNKIQLNQLERSYQLEQAEKLMEQGVTLADKNRFDVRGSITAGKDTFIDFN